MWQEAEVRRRTCQKHPRKNLTLFPQTMCKSKTATAFHWPWYGTKQWGKVLSQEIQVQSWLSGTAYVFASIVYVHIKGLQKHSHLWNKNTVRMRSWSDATASPISQYKQFCVCTVQNIFSKVVYQINQPLLVCSIISVLSVPQPPALPLAWIPALRWEFPRPSYCKLTAPLRNQK